MANSSPNLVKKFFEYLVEYGPKDTLQRSSSSIAVSLFRAMFHKRVEPTLTYLSQHALSMHTSAQEIVSRYLLSSAESPAVLASLQQEHAELEQEIASRYQAADALPYPVNWGVEKASSFLVYAIVRILQPKIMVETGVANGVSSFFILHAMRRNGKGTLVSVDIDPRAGCLLADHERQQWDFKRLKSPFKRNFAAILAALGPIDVFLHDSDHWYGWTEFEFQCALPRMNSDAVLICDDADSSLAFADLCRQRHFNAVYLVDTRKVFAFALLGAPCSNVGVPASRLSQAVGAHSTP